MILARFLDPAGTEHLGTPLPGATQAQILHGPPLGPWTPTPHTAPIAQLLSPIPTPPAILAIGLNYRHHALEMGVPLPSHPVLFFKNPASLQHPGQPILIPSHLPSTRVDYEAELAIVISRPAKNVSRTRARDFILGYTAANDVSARDWQKDFGGSQWCRGKSFDTFCPLGPYLLTPDELPEPPHLRLRTSVNGETLQDASTADMIFDIPTLIEFLSGSTTLLPGTVILTGTPSGVGMGRTPPRYLQPGDTVSITIDLIGTLTNPVLTEPLP
ncbi:MAG: fumarylacetoacetate hydrolase family protein [Verrucomicrobiia bacterium]